jgi:hypothetical protein
VDADRAFGVASDQRLIDLIERAKGRLVVVCPALKEPVARALAGRFPEEGELSITVIMDADPEVYRLGFGTPAAFDLLRKAAERYLLDLRVQRGVRIGVIISDDLTMVYCPTPLLVEAGSTSMEKPNAIVIKGGATESLAVAAGAGTPGRDGEQEIGKDALTPGQAKAVQDDLKVNPPQSFDVARALRVFSSKLMYVEFEVENYRLSSRQIPLPPDLLGVVDDDLEERIAGRVRAMTVHPEPFRHVKPGRAGATTHYVDEKWLANERKRIEDEYTYLVPRYGRLILQA